jgi:hypothetical protein
LSVLKENIQYINQDISNYYSECTISFLHENAEAERIRSRNFKIFSKYG